jgi:hypothetical protein
LNFTIPESVVQWIIGTFGAGTIALIWGIIQTPRQIKALRSQLEQQEKMFKQRIFPKLKRIEDYLIERALRELPDDGELSDLLKEMRADQRHEADLRDSQKTEH